MRCWSCERENLSTARFCAVCGARLGCAACGTPHRAGQHTCAGCGLQCVETSHFQIHYAIGSFAEQDLEPVVRRLEAARDAYVDMLALDAARIPTIRIYLSDSLEDPRQPGVALPNGYAVPRRMEIHALVQADAPNPGLEQSLLTLLLAVELGTDRAQTPLIVDGLLACALQRQGTFPLQDQVAEALSKAEIEGTLPPLLTLFGGITEENQATYYLAASSFVHFLLDTFGAGAVKDLLRRLVDSEPETAVRAVFRRRLSRIQEDWHRSLPGTRPGRILWTIKLCGAYLRPYPFQVAELLLYSTIGVGFTIGLAKMQGLLLDKALIPGDRQMLVILTGIMVGAFIVVSLTGLRMAYLTAYVGGRVSTDLAQRLFTVVQYLHLGFFQRMRSGDIISRSTGDLGMVEIVLNSALLKGFQLGLTFILALVLIVHEDWRLSLIAIAAMPLFLVTGRVLGPPTARASHQRQRHLAALLIALQENLSTLPVVKAFGLQPRMIEDYKGRLNTAFRSSLRVTYLSSIFGVSANALTYGIQIIIFGVGGWMVTGGDISVGTLFTFIALLNQLISPMQNVTKIFETLSKASGALGRVQELLDAPAAIQDRPGARPVGRLSRDIRLENVSFTYTGQQTILDNLSLTIPAGKRVALVGSSGCGKTTVLSLLMRFYDPQQGCVMLDDIDVRDVTEESLRGQMAIVLQDSVLFHISLRENIRLGNLNATDEEVEAAAKAAEIHDLIESLPDGYDSIVGERGSRLSGGQRQRIAIARAIVRNPAILLLDEATSALDPATEAAINTTLNRLSRGRTTIFVTHRLSSVVTADMIYVLDRGRMVEHGRHNELLARGGVYAHLWQQQGGGAEPEPAMPPDLSMAEAVAAPALPID
jgi:ABC-type multidrug transport system fused ATPase/permease subunit